MSEPRHQPSFFREMKSFSRFVDLNAEEHYRTAPRDWWVVITDVKGSTRAIEEGRYRDVNLIGAAAIVCITNVLGPGNFPFVFGGDGATALIPGTHKKAVEEELNALRNMSRDGFKLGLRVGLVSVAQLEDEGFPVRVAKYALNRDLSIAMFQGGTLTHAEGKIKGEEATYELPDLGETETDLSTLTCNWKPIIPEKGCIVSLIVMARGEQDRHTYISLLQELDEVFDGGVDSANPVNTVNLRYSRLETLLRTDVKMSKGFARVRRYFFSFLVTLLFSYGLRRLFPSLNRYVDSKARHSDYRKFDDALRMTVDCSAQQLEEIKAICAREAVAGRIYYGIHVSDSALMTCFVQNLKEGQHIHFIDGGSGGYAMAAKQLKAQMRTDQAKAPANRA